MTKKLYDDGYLITDNINVQLITPLGLQKTVRPPLQNLENTQKLYSEQKTTHKSFHSRN